MPHAFRSRCKAVLWLVVAASLLTFILKPATAQQAPKETLFRNVRVLDVENGSLSSPTNVLIRGNQIADIGNAAQAMAGATVIDGHGRTLMPGLIDNHVHIAFSSMSLKDLESPDTKPEQLEAAAAKA